MRSFGFSSADEKVATAASEPRRLLNVEIRAADSGWGASVALTGLAVTALVRSVMGAGATQASPNRALSVCERKNWSPGLVRSRVASRVRGSVGRSAPITASVAESSAIAPLHSASFAASDA